MSENPATSTSRALGAAALGPRSNQDVVFIDVGARQIDSNVVRDGLPVARVRIDPEVFKDVVAVQKQIPYKVVWQSVPAGTAVPLGTSVDLIVTDPFDLPVGIVQGVHRDLSTTRVAEAYDRLVRGKPQASRLVLRAAEGPLSATDEQALKELFAGGNVEIQDDVPGRDVAAAVETLRMLTTFGGS